MARIVIFVYDNNLPKNQIKVLNTLKFGTPTNITQFQHGVWEDLIPQIFTMPKGWKKSD